MGAFVCTSSRLTYSPFEQVIRKRRLPLQKAKAKKAADLFDDVFAFHSGSD